MAPKLGQIPFADIEHLFDFKLLNAALHLIEQNRVKPGPLDDQRVTGTVTEAGTTYACSVNLVGMTLNMTCECGKMKESPCVHVSALLLYFTIGMQQDSEKLIQSAGPAVQPVARTPTNLPPLFLSASPQEIFDDWRDRMEYKTVKEMREIAAAWGFKLKGIVRDQVLTGLVEGLMQPATLARVLGALPADTRCVLDLICSLHHIALAYQFSTLAPYLQAALKNVPSARPLQNCLGDLAQMGLYTDTYGDGSLPVPLQVITLPRATPALFKLWNAAPPQIEQTRPLHFAQAALRLLLLDHSGRLQRDQAAPQLGIGAWPVKTTAEAQQKEIELHPEAPYLENKLRAALARDLALPPEAVDLAARLLDDPNLWSVIKAKKPAAKLHYWLQLNLMEHSRRLFALAAVFPTQVELDAARQTGVTFWHTTAGAVYPEFMRQLALTRMLLVHLLSYMPPGQWVDIQSILDLIQGLQPGWYMEFQSRQKGSQFWEKAPVWASLARRRVDPCKPDDWMKSFGQMHLATLTRFLPWLGLLDVGLKNDRPVAVRLSEFGEFLLNRRSDFASPAGTVKAPPLALNAAGLLELDLETAPFDLIQLVLQIGLPENAAHSANSSRRLCYRLSDSHLGEVFEAGWTMQGLAARLEEGLQKALPAALRAHLEEIWNRFGRLQIYENMTLIELADDFALPELLAGSRLSQILLYTFSPRLVAIRSDAAAEFISELQAKGYTPRVEGGVSG